MAYTKDETVVTQWVIDKLTTLVPASLQQVFYGIQELSPKLPVAHVESGRKLRSTDVARGASTHKFGIHFVTQILLIVGRIQDTQITKKAVEQLAELVEDTLATDRTMGGIVVFSWVSSIDPGTVVRESVMYRASRLTLESDSREQF